MKLRRLIAVGLLGAGMTLLPVSVGVAAAANNNNNGNGNGSGGNNGGNNGNGQGKGPKCSVRGNSGHYPQAPQCRFQTSTGSANPGDAVSFSSNTGNGSVTLHSTPVLLGTFTNADNDGNVSGTVVIPCNTAAGVHTLQYDGTTLEGDPIALTASLNVSNKACVLGEQVTNTQTPAAATPAATPASGSTTGASTLPFTGAAATTMLVTLALGLIAAGGVALTAAKRRRTA